MVLSASVLVYTHANSLDGADPPPARAGAIIRRKLYVFTTTGASFKLQDDIEY